MPRDCKVYLEDILEAIQKIGRFTEKQTLKKFSNDEKTFDAVIRNLEIIGEAINKFPEEVRKKHPEVEWRKISGLRNVLIHEYFGINAEIIWDIVRNKLPQFEKQIRKVKKTL